MPKRKPSLTIVGAGRLGTALAIALSRVGYPIHALVGRHRGSLKQAAALLDEKVALLVLKEVQRLGDVVLMTTPDDQLPSIARTLAALETSRPHFAFHTSGALSSRILAPLAERGWRVGSIHPLVSVSDPVVGAESLQSAFWCLEGDPKAIRQGRLIVQDLGGRSFSIEPSAKPLYHAAAVMTSGNVVALFETALVMLEQAGLARENAQEILIPLLQSSVANLTHSSPANALTGTFSRGDLTTVERHLKALRGKKLKDARALYRLLGQTSLTLAKAKGLDQKTALRITRLLKD